MRHLILFMLAIELTTAQRVRAQTSKSLTPSVSFGTTYDDNLFATVKGDAGVMTVMRPTLEADYVSARLNATSLFSFDVQHSNFPALSTLDARRRGIVDIYYRTTPAMTLSFGARYDRTETPGELNLDSGILGPREIADRVEVEPSLSYRTTTRTTTNASYNGMTETEVGYTRGVLHVARGGVTHQVTAHDDFGVSYLGRRFDDTATHTSNAVLAAWGHDLASATRVTLQAGPRLSLDKGLAAEVVAGFTRYTNRARLGLDYWHGETMILGIEGPVAVDSATAKATWPVSPRSEIGAQTGFTSSTTLIDQKVRVYNAVARAAWTPRGGNYTFAASYAAEVQQGLVLRTLFIPGQVIRHTFRATVTIAPRSSRTFRPTG